MHGKNDDDGVATVEIDKNTRRVAYEKYLDEKTPRREKKCHLWLWQSGTFEGAYQQYVHYTYRGLQDAWRQNIHEVHAM